MWYLCGPSRYIFPESNMAVVSLGLSSGATAVCPSGSFNYPNGTPSIGFGYDEGTYSMHGYMYTYFFFPVANM